MSAAAILIVILLVLLVGGLPQIGLNSSFGYAPSGILGVILVILVALLLLGRL